MVLSHHTQISGWNHFFLSSSCEGLKDIFLSGIYLFAEWRKGEHGEEKPLLLMEAPDLLPAGHHLFLFCLAKYSGFGLGWLQPNPVTLCEPEEPS